MWSEIVLSLIGLGILISSRTSALVAAAIVVATLFRWVYPSWLTEVVIYTVLARAVFEYSASKLMDFISRKAPEGVE